MLISTPNPSGIGADLAAASACSMRPGATVMLPRNSSNGSLRLAAKKLAFNAGVLEMDCAYAKGLTGAYSDNYIRETLVEKL